MDASAKKNLETLPIAKQQWDDDNRDKALDSWYQNAERCATEAIDWYFRGKAWKSRFGRGLRLCAILLASTGVLIPVFAGTAWAKSLQIDGQVGFLALGLGGACVVLDRFFGNTTGWIRYVSTALRLQKALTAFRLDWAKNEAKNGGAKPTTDFALSQLGLVGILLDSVHQGVIDETNAWAIEFQANLDKSIRSLVEEVDVARSQGSATPKPKPPESSE